MIVHHFASASEINGKPMNTLLMRGSCARSKAALTFLKWILGRK